MSEPAISLTLSGAIPEGLTVFEPGEEARSLLRNGITGQEYVDRLLEQKLFPDAARFIACLLPKRQAVFWACQCAKRFYGGNPPPEKAAALAAAQGKPAPGRLDRQLAELHADVQQWRGIYGTPL